jgi:hypothetical protein
MRMTAYFIAQGRSLEPTRRGLEKHRAALDVAESFAARWGARPLWRVDYYSGRVRGLLGLTHAPLGWRHDPEDDAVVPDTRHPEGKRIAAEMAKLPRWPSCDRLEHVILPPEARHVLVSVSDSTCVHRIGGVYQLGDSIVIAVNHNSSEGAPVPFDAEAISAEDFGRMKAAADAARGAVA